MKKPMLYMYHSYLGHLHFILMKRISRLKYGLVRQFSGSEFTCPECGWKGILISHPGKELVMGTYCPCCSDQK